VHILDAHVESLGRHEPHALSPTFSKFSNDYRPLTLPPIYVKFPDIYKPLYFPPILHDLPINYINNLSRFDGENVKITGEKDIQSLEDFIDLFEVEDDDVSIIMFSLSLQGKVKNWFKGLLATNISNFHQFVKNFLDQ
jgi:hypothetical protein